MIALTKGWLPTTTTLAVLFLVGVCSDNVSMAAGRRTTIDTNAAVIVIRNSTVAAVVSSENAVLDDVDYLPTTSSPATGPLAEDETEDEEMPKDAAVVDDDEDTNAAVAAADGNESEDDNGDDELDDDNNDEDRGSTTPLPTSVPTSLSISTVEVDGMPRNVTIDDERGNSTITSDNDDFSITAAANTTSNDTVLDDDETALKKLALPGGELARLQGKYMVVMREDMDANVTDFMAPYLAAEPAIALLASMDALKMAKCEVNLNATELESDDPGAFRRAKMLSLLKSPNVEYVEEDQVMKNQNDQAFPPWGLDRIDQSDSGGNNQYHFDQVCSA